jgi:hypothetical protein
LSLHESNLACASDGARWRASTWPLCTRWLGYPRLLLAASSRSLNRRARNSTTHDANMPRSPDSSHVVSNRTRFGTPSRPSGSTRHEGTGVLLATRERPGVGRWHRATSLSIPAEGEAFRKAYVPRRCVLPLSWLFTISPAILRRESSAADNTLFALRRKLKKYSESPKVYGTERWIKKVRLRIDARSQRPIRLTALVARQRRVKLTSNFHSSAGRRAGLLRVRNHGDESVVRQQGR